MEAIQTPIPDLLILEPKVFDDARGFFFESFNAMVFRELTDLDVQFVQDSHSRSAKGVLRGMHYQIRQTQGKLVRVVQGEVFDVAVDLRQGSRTFGKWFGVVLSEQNRRQLWIPGGFAHGYLVLSAVAETLYKATNYYSPEHERSLHWKDADVGIQWPLEGDPILSTKDAMAKRLSEAEVFS